MRQGGDPRLPLELALVKVTRPQPTCRASRSPTGSSCSSEAAGVLRRPGRRNGAPGARAHPAGRARPDRGPAGELRAGSPAAEPPPLELDQLQEAWRRTILAGGRARARSRSATTLAEAHPVDARRRHADARVPAGGAFHLSPAEEPKNAALLRDALYEVTGRKLALESISATRASRPSATIARELSEEDVISLMKSTFDAEEVEEH